MNDIKRFEGIRIYPLNIRRFNRGSAFTLPGIGIFVGKEQIGNMGLLRHEFGHVLQSRQQGMLYFWILIAPASLWSAFRTSFDKNHIHMHVRTEWTANRLAYDYFRQPSDWDFVNYPVQETRNLSSQNKTHRSHSKNT